MKTDIFNYRNYSATLDMYVDATTRRTVVGYTHKSKRFVYDPLSKVFFPTFGLTAVDPRSMMKDDFDAKNVQK